MLLRELISGEIAARGGWIPFSRYMELALHSAQGYYGGGAQKLGPAGDFITAPELGRVFGRTLARQLKQLAPPAILELGAGSGRLAETLLSELDCEYFILETSAELRGRQSDRLKGRVRFLERLPERFRGVVLANEVADALPVHVVSWTGHAVMEKGVSVENQAFVWADRPAVGAVLEAAQAIKVPAPYVSEIGLAARAWMRSLAGSLHEGVILVIDYGFPQHEYYHPQRACGTLMCHYRHQAHADPFALPGEQDITAHVDFSALWQAASETGARLLGYTTQAQFLVNCGITEVLAQVNAENALHYAPIAAQAQKLLSPAEMGELFKVLAVGRGTTPALIGFSRGERSHSL